MVQVTHYGSEQAFPRRYNRRVPITHPENDSVRIDSANIDSAQKQHRHAVYASETTGLLLIAGVLLILTLVRFWHEIHWSLR